MCTMADQPLTWTGGVKSALVTVSLRVEDLPHGHHRKRDQANEPGVLGKAHQHRLPFALVAGLPFLRLLLLPLVQLLSSMQAALWN